MKCLFFLHGEKRTFETARKFWNILDIPNLDIVIHTPTTTSDYWGSNDFKSVNKNHFDVLDSPKVFLYGRNDFKETDNHVLHYSYRFLSKYLTDNQYDFVFVSRLDSTFYIENYKKYISNKTEVLYITLPIENSYFVQDHTFFGSYETIKKFVDNLPDTKFFEDSHKGMAIYMKENFEQKEWIGYESVHIRPNMLRYFEKYYEKFGNLKNVDSQYMNFINDFKKNYEYKLDIEYKKTYRVDWIKDYKFKDGELENMYLSFLKNLNK